MNAPDGTAPIDATEADWADQHLASDAGAEMAMDAVTPRTQDHPYQTMEYPVIDLEINEADAWEQTQPVNDSEDDWAWR